MTLGEFRKETYNMPDDMEIVIQHSDKMGLYLKADTRFREAVETDNSNWFDYDLPYVKGRRVKILELVESVN